MAYWLFKSEPNSWSWDDQRARGAKGEHWDGVRNYQANNNMKAMRRGDLGFFYHSVKEKQIVGLVQIIKEHYPDDSDAKGRFGMVDIMALDTLPVPVTLEQIKADPALAEMALLKQSRLSVAPVRADEWTHICQMGGIKKPPLSKPTQ